MPVEIILNQVPTFESENIPKDALIAKWASEQSIFSKSVVFDSGFNINSIKYIGGVDISYVKTSNTAFVCLSIHDAETTKLHTVFTMKCVIKIPYIAEFLGYKEVPVYLEVLKYVKTNHPELMPGLLFVDGGGYWHPRRCGGASWLSLQSGIPCVGITKKLLVVDNVTDEIITDLATRVAPNPGDVAEVISPAGGDTLGAIYNPTGNPKSLVYISVGSGLTLSMATKLVTAFGDYRNNEAVRAADSKSREHCRAEEEKLNPPPERSQAQISSDRKAANRAKWLEQNNLSRSLPPGIASPLFAAQPTSSETMTEAHSDRAEDPKKESVSKKM